MEEPGVKIPGADRRLPIPGYTENLARLPTDLRQSTGEFQENDVQLAPDDCIRGFLCIQKR